MIAGVVIVGAAAAVKYGTLQASMKREALSRAHLIATALISATENIESEQDLARLIKALGADPEVRRIVIFRDEPARVSAATRQDWIDLLLPEIDDEVLTEQVRSSRANPRREFSQLIGETLHFAHTYSFIVPGGPLRPTIGTVVMSLDVGPLQEEVRRQLVTLALGGGLAGLLVLLGLGTARTFHLVIKPLERLRNHLQSRTASRQPLDLAGFADDEIGLTARALHDAEREIAEQIQRNEANARRLEIALGASRQGLFELDLATGSMTTDRTYAELLGEDPATFSEHEPSWLGRMHPEDTAARRQIDDCLSGKITSFEVELRFRTRAGRWRWLQTTGTGVTVGAGPRASRLVGTVLDLHERKLREAELVQNEARWRAVYEGTPLGIVAADPAAGRVVFHNPAMARLFGTGPDGLVGLHFSELHPPEEGERVQRHFAAISNGDLSPATVPCRRRDGLVIHCSITPRLLVLDGRTLLLAFFADVTNQHLATQALITSQQELSNAQRLARLGGWRCLPDGKGVACSEWMLELVGLKNPPHRGEELEALIPEPDRSAALAAWRRVCSGETTELEHRVRAGDRELWFFTRAQPVRSDSGAVLGISGISREITETKNAELAAARSRRLDDLAALAGGIAHDLNNLLAPVLATAQLLRIQHPLAAQGCDLIEGSARRASNITRQLLHYARGGEGPRRPVALSRELHELVAFARASFDRSVAVSLTVAPDLPAILADPVQLQQILLNLCANARDAMPGGGGIRVRADVVPPQDMPSAGGFGAPVAPGSTYICISVSDTGPGVPPALMDRVFDPFFTTKPSDKGTGLGLANVLGLTRSHDGFVTVENLPGAGACFRVWLPAPATPPAPAAEPVAVEEIPQPKRRFVLVADDEAAIRQTLALVLAQHGLSVLEAADGHEAVRLLQTRGAEIGLLFTDICIPGMNGLDICRAARGVRDRFPLVVMTGMADRNILDSVQALGPLALLPKPFTLGDVNSVVEKWRSASTRAPFVTR